MRDMSNQDQAANKIFNFTHSLILSLNKAE